MRLLIAIPVHNEQKYVDRVIDKIRRFHGDILVVDDGSTDATPEILSRRSDVKVLRHSVNGGYGASLIDAFAYADTAGYDWVLTMDCDEQHEPERIPSFVEAIKTDRWDIVSGSRYLSPRKDDDLPPGDRRSINATITQTLNDLFHLHLTDAFCGYKAHRVSAMRRLRLTETGYAFPLQLWPQIWSAGLRLTELPVRLIYNDPNRHFGGNLDDAGNRLRHYLDVLKSEMARPLSREQEKIVLQSSMDEGRPGRPAMERLARTHASVGHVEAHEPAAQYEPSRRDLLTATATDETGSVASSKACCCCGD